MSEKTIARLLQAKELHSRIAKKNVTEALHELAQIQAIIKNLEDQLAIKKNEAPKKRARAFSKALASELTVTTYTNVCNIYDIIDKEILTHSNTIVKNKNDEQFAITKLKRAQQKMAQCLQKEEKIRQLATIKGREVAVRTELLGEDA